MSLSEENAAQKELIENNKTISQLLRRNEELIQATLKKDGTDLSLYVLPEDRINIPSGLIGTSAEFIKKGHLDSIVPDKTVRSNVAYAMQLSDYYRYLFGRFFIWGSIETLLCKTAIINLVAIIEALILEAANNINMHCKKCSSISECESNINKNERNNMKEALKKLIKIGALEFTQDEEDFLVMLYDNRNKVHIRLSKKNEFVDDTFNKALYNKAAAYIPRICDQLYQKAVPCYSSCAAIEELFRNINDK